MAFDPKCARTTLWSVLATLSVSLGGCKLNDKASTESFRSSKRDLWIFGKERTSLLLHQFVIDNSQPTATSAVTDPSLRSLRPIKACWYPLEKETKEIQPLLNQNRISALYDLAPLPVTEYAVPMDQLLLTIEKVPELRSINDSFKKATARALVNMPVDMGLDWAICWAGVGTAIALGAPTFGLSAGVIGFACGIGLGFTGAFEAVKDPLRPGINYVADKAAGATGEILNDTRGRRKAITERLPIGMENGELQQYVEASVAEMPEIGWDEMQKLQEILRNLGSSRSNTFPDGTPKIMSPANRCQSISSLKATGKFFAPDMNDLPQDTKNQLQSQGFTPSDIEAFRQQTLGTRHY